MRLFSYLAVGALAVTSAAYSFVNSNGALIHLPDEPMEYNSTNAAALSGLYDELQASIFGGDIDHDSDPVQADPNAMTLMWFYVAQNFDPRYTHEPAGDPDLIPGVCLSTFYPRLTRSIEFKDNRAFHCVAFEKATCDNNAKWIYFPSMASGTGYPDLGNYGWDKRIVAYRCFWGYECTGIGVDCPVKK